MMVDTEEEEVVVVVVVEGGREMRIMTRVEVAARAICRLGW